MDFIRVIPSASLLSVLEELHSCPGAPKAIKQFFEAKKKSSEFTLSGEKISITSRKRNSPNPKETNSERSSMRENPRKTEELKSRASQKDEAGEVGGARPSCELLLLATSDVRWCHAKLQERGMPQRIHQLLDESEILLPKYEPPPRNPELEARIQKLRAEQANKEYERMTQSISQLKKGYSTTIGNEYRELHQEMTKHLITGLQYLLSVVGTFYALFMAVSLVTPDFAVRVVLGICGALVVALAEIYFIIRDDIRLENSKIKKLN